MCLRTTAVCRTTADRRGVPVELTKCRSKLRTAIVVLTFEKKLVLRRNRNQSNKIIAQEF